MKTKATKSQNSELKSRPNNRALENRPRIDLELRRVNRALDTEKLLDLLRSESPHLYDLAEIIGKWVWITFAEKQKNEVTSALSQCGFYWNNRRKCWQHPCGTIPERADYDPRRRYGSHFAADRQAA